MAARKTSVARVWVSSTSASSRSPVSTSSLSKFAFMQCCRATADRCLPNSYATLLFQRLGLDDVKSRIIAAGNGTEYFLASLIAIFLIDRVGRRPLMLFGAIGQTITMVLLAVLGKINTPGCQVASAVLLFVFNSFFAIGWLGMTWLYVSHIFP